MTLSQINTDLKALKIGVSVEVLGDNLYLRATLPPKPTSKRRSPHQQRIALGISASEEGLRRAKAEAIKLGGLLACKDFEWSLYVKSEKLTCGEWCQKFKRDYYNRKADTPQTKTTYRSNYQQIFNKLPKHRQLTERVIKNTLLAIANTTAIKPTTD